MSVTSVVTPVVSTPAAVKAKGKGKLNGSVSPSAITRDQAIAAAFDYGQSMAGMDGTLVRALVAFRTNVEVQAEMLAALNVGYVMKKLAVDKPEATRIVGLSKFNEDKQDDAHRTFEQERVMIAVRVLWSRAKKMAGFPKTEAMAKAEATRAAKESERTATEARLVKADSIVNPKDDADPFESLAALVVTMRHLQKKYADKLTGERGTAWRDWLAAAPKA